MATQLAVNAEFIFSLIFLCIAAPSYTLGLINFPIVVTTGVVISLNLCDKASEGERGEGGRERGERGREMRRERRANIIAETDEHSRNKLGRGQGAHPCHMSPLALYKYTMISGPHNNS